MWICVTGKISYRTDLCFMNCYSDEEREICISFWKIDRIPKDLKKKTKGWTAWEIPDAKC